MGVVREPNFYDWSIYIEGEEEGKPLSKEILETLSRMIAFSYDRLQQTPIRCNYEGKLQVQQEAVRTDYMMQAQVTLGAAAAAIVGHNHNRRTIHIVNSGAVDMYIAWQGAPALATGYLLQPGQHITLEGYTGVLYGITAGAAGQCRYIELRDQESR